MIVLLDFSIYPMDKGESVSPYVARCLQVIESSGLDYRCHAMGTSIEGELDQALGVVQRCFETLAADCNRIECNIKIDYRKGSTGQLEAKVASVEQKLGHAVKR